MTQENFSIIISSPRRVGVVSVVKAKKVEGEKVKHENAGRDFNGKKRKPALKRVNCEAISPKEICHIFLRIKI